MADTLRVSRKTLSKIINERGAITPDMALRLSRASGQGGSWRLKRVEPRGCNIEKYKNWRIE